VNLSQAYHFTEIRPFAYNVLFATRQTKEFIMQKTVKPIPDGYNTITPHLTFKDAKKAIEFYKKALGAKEMECHQMENGKIIHATLKIGNSMLMLADEFPEHSCGISTPHQLNGTTAMFHLYFDNVDVAFNQAVSAGAKVKMPLADMFWGDRYGQLEDPFGHLWSMSTHIADVSSEEVEKGTKQCCK
jgi:PhnB protein